jgi:hypothetical protein
VIVASTAAATLGWIVLRSADHAEAPPQASL